MAILEGGGLLFCIENLVDYWQEFIKSLKRSKLRALALAPSMFSNLCFLFISEVVHQLFHTDHQLQHFTM